MILKQIDLLLKKEYYMYEVDMETSVVLDKIIMALKSFEVKDLEVLNVSKKANDVEYMIMCTALSEEDAKMIAHGLENMLKGDGISLKGKDGFTKGTWIVLDYDKCIVHIFTEMAREKYSLEKLWKDGKNKVNF